LLLIFLKCAKPHLRLYSFQRLQAAEHAAAAAAFRENLANARAEAARDRMQQAESQLQLRVQELESVRESLAELQSSAEVVANDRDALRQALSSQDKAMQAMKAYIGSIAAAPAPAPPVPAPVEDHAADAGVSHKGGSQQVLEALEAQLKAAKQARDILIYTQFCCCHTLKCCGFYLVGSLTETAGVAGAGWCKR
jgi:DNA repair exonuclease SbcCD ATPase subunit